MLTKWFNDILSNMINAPLRNDDSFFYLSFNAFEHL